MDPVSSAQATIWFTWFQFVIRIDSCLYRQAYWHVNHWTCSPATAEPNIQFRDLRYPFDYDAPLCERNARCWCQRVAGRPCHHVPEFNKHRQTWRSWKLEPNNSGSCFWTSRRIPEKSPIFVQVCSTTCDLYLKHCKCEFLESKTTWLEEVKKKNAYNLVFFLGWGV